MGHGGASYLPTSIIWTVGRSLAMTPGYEGMNVLVTGAYVASERCAKVIWQKLVRTFLCADLNDRCRNGR